MPESAIGAGFHVIRAAVRRKSRAFLYAGHCFEAECATWVWGDVSSKASKRFFPFDLGAQTEIRVEVNSWFFRAMGHVRALRERSGISLEFLHMSAGGQSMLADLIADLERPRNGVARQERLIEHSRQLLRGTSSLGSARDRGAAIVGTIVPAQSIEEASAAAKRSAWVRALHPGATSLDIFV